LLVWKFKDPDEFKQGELGTFEISIENQIIADLSVFSFLKVIAKINKL
jgi:hypothetical protein